jgi:hypothetical protein
MFGSGKKLKGSKTRIKKAPALKIRGLLLVAVCFVVWLGISQAGQETLTTKYEDLARILGKNNVAAAAAVAGQITLAKSPFVEKAADEKKPPLPAGTAPTASIPGSTPKMIALKAVIYSDDGDNVAIIKDDKSEKTVKVNAETPLGRITEIGRDYIVVGGQLLSLSRK